MPITYEATKNLNSIQCEPLLVQRNESDSLEGSFYRNAFALQNENPGAEKQGATQAPFEQRTPLLKKEQPWMWP